MGHIRSLNLDRLRLQPLKLDTAPIFNICFISQPSSSFSSTLHVQCFFCQAVKSFMSISCHLPQSQISLWKSVGLSLRSVSCLVTADPGLQGPTNTHTHSCTPPPPPEHQWGWCVFSSLTWGWAVSSGNLSPVTLHQFSVLFLLGNTNQSAAATTL